MNHLILIALLMALFANATASNNVSTHENVPIPFPMVNFYHHSSISLSYKTIFNYTIFPMMVQISNNDHHALFGELSLNRRMYMMNDQMVYERDFVNNNRTVDRRLKWQRMNETVVCNVDSNIELTVRSVLETHIANGVAQNQVHYLQSFPNGNHPIHMWEYFVPNGPTFEITARQSMSRLEINQITILLQDRTIVLTDIDWTFNRVMPLDFFTPPAEC